jgi:hypothetical protein
MSINKAFESNPRKRVITINLLVSAAAFESNEAMNFVALENLTHSIDIFCLYDQAIVLRRGDVFHPKWKSDFFGALKDANFLTFIQRSPQEVDAICRVASAHLAPALGVASPIQTNISSYFSLLGTQRTISSKKPPIRHQSKMNGKRSFRRNERNFLVQMLSWPAPSYTWLMPINYNLR